MNTFGFQSTVGALFLMVEGLGHGIVGVFKGVCHLEVLLGHG